MANTFRTDPTKIFDWNDMPDEASESYECYCKKNYLDCLTSGNQVEMEFLSNDPKTKPLLDWLIENGATECEKVIIEC